MLMVSSLVVKIHFAVLDDVIAPVIEVEGSVRTFINVHGPIHAGGPVAVGTFGGNVNEVMLLGGEKAGAVVTETKTEGAMATEIVGHKKPSILFWKDARGNDFEAAMLGLAGIEAGEDFAPTMVRGCYVSCTGEGVMDAGPARAVGEKRLAEVVGLVPPWIDQSVGENLKVMGVGVESPNAAFAQATNSPRGFCVRVDVDGLGKAYSPIFSVAETMHDMVGVLGAEAGDEDGLLVSLAIVVRVTQVKDFGGGSDVHTTVPRENRSGHEKSVGEDLASIRHTVAVDVLQHDYLVVDDKSRGNVRVTFRGCDP